MEKMKIIPMDEIDPEAIQIAVAWMDYIAYSTIHPEIAQTYKMASDIMNFAIRYNEKLTSKLKEQNNGQ